VVLSPVDAAPDDVEADAAAGTVADVDVDAGTEADVDADAAAVPHPVTRSALRTTHPTSLFFMTVPLHKAPSDVS
jgi:hypothetical protein